MLALSAALLLAAASPEADIRALVGRLERAWNAGDAEAYFAGFAPEAVFVDQARTGETITPYGRATLGQARVQTRRFLTTSKSTETSQVRAVRIAGAEARVLSAVTARITARGAARTICLDREQVLRLDGGRWRVTARTDTLFRCPRR